MIYIHYNIYLIKKDYDLILMRFENELFKLIKVNKGKCLFHYKTPNSALNFQVPNTIMVLFFQTQKDLDQFIFNSNSINILVDNPSILRAAVEY